MLNFALGINIVKVLFYVDTTSALALITTLAVSYVHTMPVLHARAVQSCDPGLNPCIVYIMSDKNLSVG